MVAIAREAVSRPIRIAVIEGQTLFAAAICRLLASDLDVEAVVGLNELDALRLRRLNADVIIVDVDGHTLDVGDVMRRCRSAAPYARVCVLTTRPDRMEMRRAIAAGVDGYLVKDMQPDELLRAVKAVASGANFVDPRIADHDTGSLRRSAHDLSAREKEVLRLIARGLSNRDISTALVLSEKTVKNHLSSIFAKIDVATRTQAALYAIKEGLA
jgi:DNA-binding NarL/FixJ family response regulator